MIAKHLMLAIHIYSLFLTQCLLREEMACSTDQHDAILSHQNSDLDEKAGLVMSGFGR